MLYFANITDKQRVRIPADGAKLRGELTLRMVNVIGGGSGVESVWDPRIYLVDADGRYVHDADGRQIAVGEPDDRTRLYYLADVELPAGIPDGEYNYEATVDGVTVSCGLAFVGDFHAPVTDYNNHLEYEQYRQ